MSRVDKVHQFPLDYQMIVGRKQVKCGGEHYDV